MLAGIFLSVVGYAVSHFVFSDAQPLMWTIPVILTGIVGIAAWWYNRGAERDTDRIKDTLRETSEEHNILARHIVTGASGNPYVAEAERYLAAGDEEQATRNYERALRANEDDVHALLEVGALSFLRCILARTLDDADAYRDHLDRALTHLEHAYNLEPHNPYVLEGLACALDEKEKTSPRAIAMLEELVASKPTHRSAHTNLGVAYMRAGRIEDAKREYIHQIDHANEFLGIFNLGEYYSETGQLYHASICYAHTIAATRRYMIGLRAGSQAFVLHNLAVRDYLRCLMYLGLIGAAITTLDEAVALWKHYDQPIPPWAPHHRYRLTVLRRLYRMAHLEFMVKRALHRPAGEGWSNRLMSEERVKPLYENGYHYELLRICQLAISLEPLAAVPHANQASLVLAYGNVDDAREEATLALALGRRNKDDVAVRGAQHVLEQPDGAAGEITLTDEDTLIQQIAMAAEAIRTVEGPPPPNAVMTEAG
jgi:tetratricopeptide (TPR) repeat protein